MRTFRFSVGVGLIVTLGSALVSFAEAASTRVQAATCGGCMPGQILVKFKDGVSAPQVDAANARMGGWTKGSFWLVPGLRLIGVPAGSQANAAAAYAGIPEAEYAEPDYLQYAVRQPDDPRFPEQWALKNTGQTRGTAGADIDAPRAWEITTGSSQVIVMVIDSGIDYTHPDLAANMWRNPGEIPGDGIDNDGDGWVDDVFGIDPHNNDGDPMDDFGHGTHVAGIIGAVGNNGQGIVGVNWNVQLMACKFLGADGSGSTSDAIRCLEYGISKGAHLTNNSWGGGGYSQALADAIRAAGAAGQLFVAAAGNDGSDTDLIPHYPCGYDLSNVLCVAWTDHRDGRSEFSNFGVSTVHVGAPGSSILSTLFGGDYGLKSGTSMATPHVTGVAALILAQNPGLPWQSVKQLILMGGDPVTALMGRTATGHRLNARRALSLPRAPYAELTLTGCTTVCRSGDTFSASASFANPTALPARVEGKAGVKLPDGTPLSLSTLPPDFVLTLAGGQTVTGVLLNTTIPLGIPAGTYRYEVALLDPELGVTVFRETRVFTVRQAVRILSHDLRAGATPVEGMPFFDYVDTRRATTSPDDPVHSCTGSQDSTTVWYSFTPTSTGLVRVNTFGSDYDTVLAAYTGMPSPTTEIACNDDTGAPQSEIQFLAFAGTTYWIEAASWHTSPGGSLVLTMGTRTEPVQLTLALAGCSTCRSGDGFSVNATLVNPNTATVPLEIKFGARLPDGTPVNLWSLPDPHFRFAVPPGTTGPVTILDAVIPPGIPSGTWAYEGILLEPQMGTPVSRSIMPFTVLP